LITDERTALTSKNIRMCQYLKAWLREKHAVSDARIADDDSDFD
jgi:hypothetical protein